MAAGVHYDGSKLFATLAEQGRFLSWLAKRTGYSENSVYSMKMGRRAITQKFAERAAIALDVPFSLLFTPIVLHESSDSIHNVDSPLLSVENARADVER